MRDTCAQSFGELIRMIQNLTDLAYYREFNERLSDEYWQFSTICRGSQEFEKKTPMS